MIKLFSTNMFEKISSRLNLQRDIQILGDSQNKRFRKNCVRRVDKVRHNIDLSYFGDSLLII